MTSVRQQYFSKRRRHESSHFPSGSGYYFDEVTFRKMLKVKHKNVFILQLDLDKNKNTILKSDFCFGFYKNWNTQWFLVGSN